MKRLAISSQTSNLQLFTGTVLINGTRKQAGTKTENKEAVKIVGSMSREKSELSYKLQGFCKMEVEYLCSFNAYLGLRCAKGEKLDKNQSMKNTRGKRNRDVMETRMVKKGNQGKEAKERE